jgi:hypothetical protein
VFGAGRAGVSWSAWRGHRGLERGARARALQRGRASGAWRGGLLDRGRLGGLAVGAAWAGATWPLAAGAG